MTCFLICSFCMTNFESTLTEKIVWIIDISGSLFCICKPGLLFFIIVRGDYLQLSFSLLVCRLRLPHVCKVINCQIQPSILIPHEFKKNPKLTWTNTLYVLSKGKIILKKVNIGQTYHFPSAIIWNRWFSAQKKKHKPHFHIDRNIFIRLCFLIFLSSLFSMSQSYSTEGKILTNEP